MSDRGSWNVLLSHPASSAGCEISGEGGTSQGGPSACAKYRDSSPWWHGASIAIRSNSIRIPQEDTQRASLSGVTPSGFPKKTRGALPYPEQLHPDSPRRHAARFPIRICCPDHWLKWASLATAHVPPLSNGVSGHLCHGFQRILLNFWLLWWSKSYKNTKT